MAEVKLVIDGARMQEFLRGPQGPISRMLIERGELVKRDARRRVPVRTGKLRDSIVKRFVEEVPGGLGIRVVAAQPYAVFVHDGTKPHVIAARRKASLAFFWANGPNGAGLYFFQSVNHPGTKAVPFLRDALPVAVAI